MTLTNTYPQDERSKAKDTPNEVRITKLSKTELYVQCLMRFLYTVTHDKDAVRSIVDAAPILHVSFNAPPTEGTEPQFPTILPMLGTTADDGHTIYLHGSSAARLFRLGTGQDSGLPVCIAATILDGYVLALTPFNHSCNYRSAVVFGYATKVVDADEMMLAMKLITNHIAADRWTNSRTPPTKSELTATGILRVQIDTASVKVRNGGPHDDKKDLKDEATVSRVWTGVVPVHQIMGEPVASPDNMVEQVPASVKSWIEDTNNMRKDHMIESMKD
ncbi:unnamed protein product [Aureobasidium vineae]|uniref:Flavin-nucleotide-binding protein n=1 Tax=Aureobasidium vineae TaxID=2773715 RepID=A0A9N8PFB7_9PEZI|nr:unnamed protein product [Aureobasidium vineae]